MLLKKKHLLLLVYAIYVLSLFGAAVYYDHLDSLPSTDVPWSLIGRGIGYARDFFFISAFSSWVFLAVAYWICHKRFNLFMLFAPFLLYIVGLFVYLPIDLVLWISQLKILLPDFQEFFIIVSISSTLIMVWMFGDVFRQEKYMPDLSSGDFSK